MNTDKRLDECYENGKRVSITDQSKLIFFSDVHRGDNSMSDEFAHNQNIYRYALENYYQEGFTYIEVGDGDELMEHSKFNHIRSAHSDIYMLIRKFYKDHRLYYLYGNHNMMLKNPQYVAKNFHHFFDEYLDIDNDLFMNIEVHESLVLEYQPTGQELLVVHGHQGDLFNDQLWFTGILGMRLFWRYMHMIGFRNPASPSKNRVKRHKIEKNFSRWIHNHGVGIICGHTHRPKLPSTETTAYINSGCCIHPRGITGIELSDGKLSLIYWYVKPDHNGSLFITKKVMKGPFKLKDFSLIDTKVK